MSGIMSTSCGQMGKNKAPCLKGMTLFYVVEVDGVEPTTPCLQSRCSSQLSYTPIVLMNFPVVCNGIAKVGKIF